MKITTFIWLLLTILCLYYSEAYLCTLICLILCIVTPFLFDVLERYSTFWGITVFTTFVIICFTAFVGLRVIKKDGHCLVVSTFYPVGRIIAVGESVDTVSLRRCYLKEENEVNVCSENMYILKSGAYTVLFSKDNVILKGTDLKFVAHEFGSGVLDLCSYKTIEGKWSIVDTYGNNVKQKNYAPIVKVIPADGYIYVP